MEENSNINSNNEEKVAVEKSLAKSSFFYLIYNVLNMIFPFVSGIYVARVLLPETVGKVAAAQNIVQYFVILAFLGLPTYGLREISKVRNDKEKLSKLSSELFSINLISTIIFSLLYFSLVLIVPSYRSNITLYIIAGCSIIFNMLNISWLYEGLEMFGFIAVRNLIVKIVSFTCLIFFVKNDSDYLIYTCINVVGNAGNDFLNVCFSRRYIKFNFKNLNLKRHMKSVMYLVMVNLAIEIYTLVDVTMLDIFSNKENVAYYTYGSKINKILLQIVNTFTMVLVPRISLMYKEGRKEEFNNLITKTFKIIILIAIPMIIGIQFVSKFLVCEIYGYAYVNSSYVLNILSLCLLISPIGYLLGSRTLLVTGNENKMIIAVGIGAIINVIGNLILIQFLNEFGAAIASVISELVVATIYVILGKKHFELKDWKKDVIKIIISAILMIIVLFVIKIFITNLLLECILQIVCAISIYGLVLILLKENLIIEVLGNVKKRICR